MPRPHEFRENSRRGVCLPACRGLCPAQRIKINMTAGGSHTTTKWATLAWLGGGVRLDFVGEYRTMAFTMSIAFTPSVTPKGVTAPPTQGSLWLVQTGSPYFDFYDSVIVSWRARHASPLQCPAGRYLKSPHTRYRKNPPAGGISLTGGSFYCILSHLCRFRSFFSRF